MSVSQKKDFGMKFRLQEWGWKQDEHFPISVCPKRSKFYTVIFDTGRSFARGRSQWWAARASLMTASYLLSLLIHRPQLF
jgi:hypothetical protein